MHRLWQMQIMGRRKNEENRFKPREQAEESGGAEVAECDLRRFAAPRGSHRQLHDACREEIVLREEEAKTIKRA